MLGNITLNIVLVVLFHNECLLVYQFHRNLKPGCQLFGDAHSRGEMFRERLLLTQQRLLRSGLFVARGISSSLSNARSDAYEVPFLRVRI